MQEGERQNFTTMLDNRKSRNIEEKIGFKSYIKRSKII
jgi:hypothetical protein